MRTITLAALGLATLLPFTAAGAAPVPYTVDPEHTYPYFEIDHLGFSTMRGRFNSTQGKITIDRDNRTGSVEITIDAESVDTAHKKRDDHLRSPDFLNAAEFPEITYRSRSVTIHDDDSATVEGELTIMGVSKPVTLDVERIRCGANPMNQREACGFDAVAEFKRSDFGVTYALPGVGDDMRLLINVEAYRD